MGKDVDGLDYTTDGTLYLSITHLQREDTVQVSDVSDTSCPPCSLGAVTASMTGHKWMFWDAKYTDFLRFCVAVHVPTHLRCLLIHHIPHRTHKAGKHSRRSCRRCQLWDHACSVVPAHRPGPLEGRYTQKRLAARPVVTGWIFETGYTFFQKYIRAVSKGPVLL